MPLQTLVGAGLDVRLETDVAFRLIRDSRAGDARRHRFSKALKRRFSQSAIRMTPARRADDEAKRGA
jgi:hypothetical protein